ncbi:helix-turn-helix domain-containing protein [Parvibaculum sp.]|uniref:TetR/AcrR family transcriptional regulator n=1 Tax=Parvibaculum sp. TaxID=2024848 RepID=UPI003299DA2B
MAVSSMRVEKQDEAGSRRRERMRAILIEAALRLFAKQGVDATTIDEIVNVAGVAKGTFYNYFTDRSEVARAVGALIRHDLDAAVTHINEGITDPAERIARGVRLFMANVVSNPDKAAMLSRLYDGGLAHDSAGNLPLLDDIRAGIDQGRIHVPGELVALHFIVGLGTVAMRHLLDTGAGSEILHGEGYARDISLMLLRGLGVPGADIERILARPFDATGFSFL